MTTALLKSLSAWDFAWVCDVFWAGETSTRPVVVSSYVQVAGGEMLYSNVAEVYSNPIYDNYYYLKSPIKSYQFQPGKSVSLRSKWSKSPSASSNFEFSKKLTKLSDIILLY